METIQDKIDKGTEPLHVLQEEVEKLIDQNVNEIAALRTAQEAGKEADRDLLAQFDRQRDELNQMKGRLDYLDKQLPKGSKIYLPGDGAKPGREQRVGLAKFLLDCMGQTLNGSPKFNTDEFKLAQTEGTTGDGGFLVHPEQASEVVQIIERYGLARRKARVFPMGKNELRIPTLATRPTVYWPDESVAPSESKATFARPAITAKRMMAVDTLSIEVAEDTVPMIADFLVDVFATAFAKEEDNQWLNGDISGNSDPFDGLLVVSGVQVLTMGGGNTTFTSLDYPDLLNLLDTPNAFAAENGEFILSNSMMLHIRNIKDSQNTPLWAQMAAGPPGTLLGRPYNLSDVMPKQSDTAISTPYMLFGDFKNSAMGTRTNSLAVDFSKEADFKAGNIVMRVMQRIGFQLLLGAGIARIRTAAA